MPINRNADTEPSIVVSRRMHRDSGPDTDLHLCSADSIGLHLHLWYLGLMPVKRNADQEPSVIISCRLHRDSGPDTVLHTARTGDLHILYLQRIWNVPVQQHADQEPVDLVSLRLHRRNAGPVTGLHLCTAGHDLHILYL